MSAAYGMLAALGIGLLLGVERERHKGKGPTRGAAGIRTFALVSLLGGVSLRVGGTVVLGVSAAFVALAALASYRRARDDDPGLTTEVALMVAFLLGALALRETALAGGLAVIVAIVLASRRPLHRLVKEALTEAELHDGLLFAAGAAVVLPLLPDRDLGPYGAVNPVFLWRIVVIVMAISALGYVALRLLGPRYGLALAGLASGFVSSTMTIVAMGRRASTSERLLSGAVAGAVLSLPASLIHNAVVMGAASGSALAATWIPLAVAALAGAVLGAVAAGRAAREKTDPVALGRAFDLRAAVGFALLLAGAVLASAALVDRAGTDALVLATVVVGAVDTSAAIASAASLVAAGQVPPDDIVVPVLAALSANTLARAVAGIAAGPRRFASGVTPALLVTITAAWGAYGLLALLP